MGTNKTNLEEYLDLWDEFEKLLEKKSMTLSSFAKKWEMHHNSDEENDYKKFYDRLKKMKQRKDRLKNIRPETHTKLETYISCINEEYLKIELFDDEKVEHWFDD